MIVICMHKKRQQILCVLFVTINSVIEKQETVEKHNTQV